MNTFLRQLYLSQLYRNQLQNYFFLRGGTDTDEEMDEALQEFLSLPAHVVEAELVPFQNSMAHPIDQVDTINLHIDHPLEDVELAKLKAENYKNLNLGTLAEIMFVKSQNEGFSGATCFALTGNPRYPNLRSSKVASGERPSMKVDLSGADCLLLDITEQGHDQVCEIKRPDALRLTDRQGMRFSVINSDDHIYKLWINYRRLAERVPEVQSSSGLPMKWCCVVVRFQADYEPCTSYISECAIFEDGIVLTESATFIPSRSFTEFVEIKKNYHQN